MCSGWINKKTIAAIATPSGAGGIGIVKMSGEDAIPIALRLFKQKRYGSEAERKIQWQHPDEYPSHQLFFGEIIDPEKNIVIDEVLISFMREPHSYTREDVVEINAHSGNLVLKRILEIVIRQGAALAEPGEFTKRAYLNGRIDLTQAEAVMDIVNAKSETALHLANMQLKGAMRDRIQSLREQLLALYAEMEAEIDFPEDMDTEKEGENKICKSLVAVKEQISDLVASYNSGHIIRDGLRISIVGKPNVGKSSLMNRLVEKDRVIVTEIPGTTRDIIEENLSLNGVHVIISDTAGLRETMDPVELVGVDRTKRHLSETDLVLFMLEAGSMFTEEDNLVYQQIKDKKKIIVLNKIDLLKRLSENPIIPESWEPKDVVKISALYNTGIDLLKKKIVCLCQESCFVKNDDGIIPNLRQALALKKSLFAVKNAQAGLQQEIPTDIITIDIREALDCLGEVSGQIVKDDVLDKIFREFCIGK